MYSAYITTIHNIRPHPNADRLQIVTVFGNDTIVDLSYHLNQKVVYFPVDGQLSQEFAEANNLLRKKDENGNNIGGYMDENKRNITAVKLRGEKSDGLLLPVEVLSSYTDITKLKDGDPISVLNGIEICKKYIPRKNIRKRSNHATKKIKNKKHNFPYFEQHVDTKQLAYNQNAFHEGDIIYLTRKLHGTSGRTANSIKITTKQRPKLLKKIFPFIKDKTTSSYEIVTGTRKVVLDDFETGHFYSSDKFREKWHNYFINKLPKGMEVFYELVGWVDEKTPIMPKVNNSKIQDKNFKKMYGNETVFTYGCEPNQCDCYIYRITMTTEEGMVIELPTEETMLWCERLGAPYVPYLEKFLYTTWEDLNERVNKYLDLPEPLANGSHISEGVVVRIDNREKFTAFKQKGFLFKCLAGIAVDSITETEMTKMSDDLLSEV